MGTQAVGLVPTAGPQLPSRAAAGARDVRLVGSVSGSSAGGSATWRGPGPASRPADRVGGPATGHLLRVERGSPDSRPRLRRERARGLPLGRVGALRVIAAPQPVGLPHRGNRTQARDGPVPGLAQRPLVASVRFTLPPGGRRRPGGGRAALPLGRGRRSRFRQGGPASPPSPGHWEPGGPDASEVSARSRPGCNSGSRGGGPGRSGGRTRVSSCAYVVANLRRATSASGSMSLATSAGRSASLPAITKRSAARSRASSSISPSDRRSARGVAAIRASDVADRVEDGAVGSRSRRLQLGGIEGRAGMRLGGASPTRNKRRGGGAVVGSWAGPSPPRSARSLS